MKFGKILNAYTHDCDAGCPVMHPLCVIVICITYVTCKGPFNNYVDKMRGKGVIICLIIHAQDIKTVYTEGGGGLKQQKSVHVVVECPSDQYQGRYTQQAWTENCPKTGKPINKRWSKLSEIIHLKHIITQTQTEKTNRSKVSDYIKNLTMGSNIDKNLVSILT